MGEMRYKNAWRKPKQTTASNNAADEALKSTKDFSGVVVPQTAADSVVCVYNVLDNASKLRKLAKKCGNLIRVEQDGSVFRVEFGTCEEAAEAVKQLHGQKLKGSTTPLKVCKDLIPPLLVTGHKPGLMIVRDVPDEIDAPDVWEALGGDESGITHISFLPTASRNIMINTETRDAARLLLSKSGIRMKNWRLRVELWFEFCFHMTRRNVVLLENLQQDTNVQLLKQQIGNAADIEYIEIIQEHSCALVYCKSKQVADTIVRSMSDASYYRHVSGLRHLVFLDNLHETVREAEIHTLLNDCGEVLKVNVSLDQRTGLKRAVACLETVDGVEKALQLHGTEHLGQVVSVTRSLKKQSTANSIFITNLHRGTQELHLCLIFQDCGHIESVSVPKQKNIVNGREAAVLIFKDPAAVEKALEKSNKAKIRGMRIIVHREDPFANRERRKLSRKRVKEQTNTDTGEPVIKKKAKTHSKRKELEGGDD